jgi:hypothetical protein
LTLIASLPLALKAEPMDRCKTRKNKRSKSKKTKPQSLVKADSKMLAAQKQMDLAREDDPIFVERVEALVDVMAAKGTEHQHSAVLRFWDVAGRAMDVEQLHRRSAVHEAGHATAQVLLGVEFETVSLIPQLKMASSLDGEPAILTLASVDPGKHAVVPEQLEGETKLDAAERWLNTDLRRMVTRMAGPAAEYVFLGNKVDDQLRRGAVLDGNGMTQQSQAMGWEKALPLMQDAWSAVLAVADALMARDQMSYEEVKALVEPHRATVECKTAMRYLPSHTQPPSQQSLPAAF